MPIAGQDQHVDLGVGEEPEQVLPEQRAAAAGGRERPVRCTTSPLGHEEAGAGDAVHELQDAGRLERREGEEQQERGDELRPDEEGQPHQRQPRRAQLDDGDDEVDRAEQRRGDEEDHADEPDRSGPAER